MLRAIIDKVLSTQSVRDKVAIANTHSALGNQVNYQDPLSMMQHTIGIGDDCAAIPDGTGGFLLFATEGIISAFVEASPWFAGYSSVMVNINDVCSMGGLPLAVTDVLWLKDEEAGKEIWEGMKAASDAYGVPIVGGHTCYRSEKSQLAVSILGKASKLLQDTAAKPGQILMMAVDLKGDYYGDYPFWNASTMADPAYLKGIMRLMYELRERDWSEAAKDISMGGIIGTLAMFLQNSSAGASVNLEAIPCPTGIEWEKWLISFPSFGYLFTCSKENCGAIEAHFQSAAISCKPIGEINDSRHISIINNKEQVDINLNFAYYA
ncbi:sll0787 family AIR synthase-like protein [Desertivirga xinjiangensis]|uniref:sll0787 family AIR synthase-like protein n=1 Tax=Desertivirga xinjiangensis TaxID=539206 RepID=UPI002108CCBD|nr:sll0787 family AIR synthase-like protein [Pedobacter xinjiangensis]